VFCPLSNRKQVCNRILSIFRGPPSYVLRFPFHSIPLFIWIPIRFSLHFLTVRSLSKYIGSALISHRFSAHLFSFRSSLHSILSALRFALHSVLRSVLHSGLRPVLHSDLRSALRSALI
jgi:hypothetical protein